MKKVLVTGSGGFIGKNLCSNLAQLPNIEVIRYEKENTLQDLSAAIKSTDFVFHLAGSNRPKNEIEFRETNVDLTKKIISFLKNHKKNIPVLITSSIQAELDNPYGQSKKAAEDLVFNWGKENNSKVYVYRLPNVFGKWCRPNYNSVVATFCHNIVSGQPISINNPSTQLNLVYIDDVIRSFLESLGGKTVLNLDGFCTIDKTFAITLQTLADKLIDFNLSRKTLKMPSLASDFDRYLYATFISYLEPKNLGCELDTKKDVRGWLAEFIKSDHVGQIFVSATKPGVTRGNHWHHTKIEKFLVVQGEAEIKLKHFFADETVVYKVNGEKLLSVDIPPGYSHNITNIGKNDLITIFWADEIFDPEKPDTYKLEVQ